jgi:hypothetical protein
VIIGERLLSAHCATGFNELLQATYVHEYISFSNNFTDIASMVVWVGK